MKTVKTIVIIFIILILIPLSSWIIWTFRPDKSLDVLVMNKTVLGLEKKEHRAIFWVLLNDRFVKNDGKAYRMDRDYYGFHPVKPLKSRRYEVRRIRLEEVERLASEYDLAYY